MPYIYKMKIYKYIPDSLYGFAILDNQQVFFHLGVFDPGELHLNPYCTTCQTSGCTWISVAPPPISGEDVEVTTDVDILDKAGKKAPKALRVKRLTEPLPMRGKVKNFDIHRGYGFIEANQISYYVHRSDILNHHIPVIGQMVMFYVGKKNDKFRSCHVKVC